MQYDAIILELMSRIQTLEQEVRELKLRLEEIGERPDSNEEEDSSAQINDSGKQTSYSKMTGEMIRACYELGEYAYEHPQEDMNKLAEKAVKTTGMNQSSAFIYIYVVKCMLSGEVYKRAINTAATQEYLNVIHQKYGQDGLDKAVLALGKHIAYRKSIGHTVDGLESLYKKHHKD